MISSSGLNKLLLESRNFQEAERLIQEHYSGPDKLDISASRKVTNILSYVIFNLKNRTNEETGFLVRWFIQALEVISTGVDQETVGKVIESCVHVINKLTEDKSSDFLATFLTALHEMVKKQKSQFDKKSWEKMDRIIEKLNFSQVARELIQELPEENKRYWLNKLSKLELKAKWEQLKSKTDLVKSNFQHEDYPAGLSVTLEIFQLAYEPKHHQIAVEYFNQGAVQLIRAENYETGAKLCQKILENYEESCLIFYALVHLWKALFGWFTAKQQLLKLQNVNPDDVSADNDNATAYTRTLTPQVYGNYLQDFQRCHDLLKENPEAAKSALKGNLDTIQQILECFMETSIQFPNEEESEVKELIEATWRLLELEEWTQVQQNIEVLLQWPDIDQKYADSYLTKAQVKLMQSQFLISRPSSIPSSESPLECLETARRCAKINVSPKNLNTILCHVKIGLLRYKIMETFLKIYVSLGLSLQIKMAAKELFGAALTVSTLPTLKSALLQCIETHLQFEDHQEAQVKLREIEHLLKVPKIKSKTLKVQNSDDICASPIMPKVTYDLKSCLKDPSASVSKQEMVLYFTYQGVVWSLEGSPEEANKYFKQVLNYIESENEFPNFQALQWILEQYAQSQDFDQVNRVLHLMKRSHCLNVTYFTEAALSLSLAEQIREDVVCSPPPIKSIKPEDLRTPAPMRPPKTNFIKPKKIKPRDYDMTTKPDMSEEDMEEGEMVKKLKSITLEPPKSTRKNAVLRGKNDEENQSLIVRQTPRRTQSAIKPKNEDNEDRLVRQTPRSTRSAAKPKKTIR